MNRNEQIGTEAVGARRTLLQRHEHVGVPREQRGNTELASDQRRGAVGDIEGHVFFPEPARTNRARVVAAVTRIEHDSPYVVRGPRARVRLGDVNHQPKWLRYVEHAMLGHRRKVEDYARTVGPFDGTNPLQQAFGAKRALASVVCTAQIDEQAGPRASRWGE